MKAGLRCVVDDNPNRSMGEKLYHWEMKGVPMRLELGTRDLMKQEVMITLRDIGKEGKRAVPLEHIE